MKRFITGVIAATALLFGFAGCSGALHDMGDAPIAKVPTKIVGAMTYTTDNVFKDMTVVDSTTSTYTFKYTTAISANWGSPADGVNFKVGYVDKEWATCWSEATAGTTALVNGAASVLCTAQNKENISFSGLTDGKTYKITATTGISCVTVAIAETDAAPVVADPTPYYFDGLYLVGGCFTTGSMTNLWSFGSDNLIHGATTDTKTGYVTYTKDITATAESGEMGINDSSWANKQLGSGITVTAGADYAELNGTEGNFKVSGLTSGDPYRVYIQTTPDKVVSVKLEKIAAYKVICKVTGLTEGTEVFVNGNLWNSWGNTWPFAKWGGKAYADAKTGDNANWFATADSVGTATFAGSVTGITKLGTTISGELKVVDCGATLLEPASLNYDNGKYTFDITSSGTYVLTIDVSNGAYDCSVAKQ
jgi:hypothetical protein